ncbi:MAG: ABC transporter ATP-binding protein [Opitutales bacterium]|nr:ABC transporter ATP-binding protein [Opitutales bacterium]
MDFFLKNNVMPNGSMRVENLFHSFSEANGTVQVLNGVSLEAKPGEITSIAGPSGCGKSTLLYLMGLLDRPDSGKVFMGNSEVQNLEDDERTKARNHFIGFVFQFHFLIKELSAIENIRLPLLKQGKDEDSANQKANELLSELGLESKAQRPAYKLSGGEQQRVAIARALANSPKYLLADEPTGNLDSSNSEGVFELLDRMAKQTGLSVILVTHNEKLADLSHQKYWMEDGRIVI